MNILETMARRIESPLKVMFQNGWLVEAKGLCHRSSIGTSSSMRHCINGAYSNRFFGALQEVEQQLDVASKVEKKYLVPVLIFVKRYIIANAGEYPMISTTVKETGASRYIVKKIMDKLKSGKLGPLSDFSIAEPQHDNHLLSSERFVTASSSEDVIQMNGLPFKAAGLDHVDSIDLSCGSCEDDHDLPAAAEDNSACSSDDIIQMNGLPSRAAGLGHADSIDLLCGSREDDQNLNALAEDNKGNSEHAVNVLKRWLSTNIDMDNNLRRSQLLKESKTGSCSQRSMQHRTVVSRRVHLSPDMGITNDLSWEEMISSAMPDPPHVQKESPAAGMGGHEVLLITRPQANSVLKTLSKAEIHQHFEDCDVTRARICPNRSHACVGFKTVEGLKRALKKIPCIIRGEELVLVPISSRGESKRVSPEIKRQQDEPSLDRRESKGILESRTKTGTLHESILNDLETSCARRKSPSLSALDMVQNSFSIDDCPSHVSLDSSWPH